MGVRREYTYREYEIEEGAVFPLTIPYSSLGTSDEGLELPEFTVTPQVEILLVRANQTIFLVSEDEDGFTINIGDVGDLPPIFFDFRVVSRETATEITGFYGDADEAAEMSGLAVSYMLASIQTQVNNLIDTRILFGNTFSTHSEDEFHDINWPHQKEIILRKCPVISISSLTDASQSNNVLTISSDDYVVDEEAGIIKLLQLTDVQALSDFKNSFTVGKHSVRIQYTWGYATVPTIIKNLATLLLARWAKINRESVQTGGVKAVRMAAGNYQETFDTSMKHITTEYDDTIKSLIAQVKALYAKGV